MRITQAIPQAQSFLRRKGVVPGHDRVDRLFHGQEHIEIAQVRGLEDQRQVAFEGAQILLRCVPVAYMYRKGNARMFGAVGSDLGRHEIGLDRLGAGNADMAAPQARQVGHLAANPVHVGQLPANMLDQQLAGRIEANPTVKAFEDGGAELFLKSKNAAVQSRRRDVHVFGGLADGTGLAHCIDQLERLKVPHFQCLTNGAANFEAQRCKNSNRSTHQRRAS